MVRHLVWPILVFVWIQNSVAQTLTELPRRVIHFQTPYNPPEAESSEPIKDPELIEELGLNIKCPIPDNRVAPKMTVSVSRNDTNGSYAYAYSIHNEPSAALSIGQVFLFIAESPSEILVPDIKSKITAPDVLTWSGDFKNDEIARLLDWSSGETSIAPGKALGGFKIVSNSGPGIVRFSAFGDTLHSPDVNTLCPDHFQDAKSDEEAQIVGATIGPVPASLNQVDGEIDYKSKIVKGKIPQISPLDKGEIEIYLKSSERLNLMDVDVKTLEFGMGKAKPKKVVYLNEHGKECDRSETRRYKKGQALKLVFNLEDVKVRCNLDYALFLKGKLSEDRNLLAALEMRPVICKPEHFAKVK